MFTFHQHGVSVLSLYTTPLPKLERAFNMKFRHVAVTFARLEILQCCKAFFPRLFERVPNKSDFVKSLPPLKG